MCNKLVFSYGLIKDKLSINRIGQREENIPFCKSGEAKWK